MRASGRAGTSRALTEAILHCWQVEFLGLQNRQAVFLWYFKQSQIQKALVRGIYICELSVRTSEAMSKLSGGGAAAGRG